jgi:hypothetical protein
VAGDILVATHADGSSLIQFIKPPLPFVLAQQTTNSWQIQFFAQKKTYSGRKRPPSRILWLQLMDALADRPIPSVSLRRMPDGRWHLENTETQEMLEGFLTTTRLPETHLVRSGETLAQLCQWYGISAPALEEVNPGLVADWFKPGKRIRLPALGQSGPGRRP